jgi:hypothetical protein
LAAHAADPPAGRARSRELCLTELPVKCVAARLAAEAGRRRASRSWSERILESAVREAERLEAAIAALDGLAVGDSAARASAPAPAAPARRRRPSTARRGGGPAKRAPRGANRAAVLGVLGERPGVGASELSSAAGVARPVLYALLKTLEERGEIAKEQPPGGTTGYRLAPASSDASSGPNDAAGG